MVAASRGRKSSYVPDRGDIVRLDFTPQSGHEQAGRRPALVLSPLSYNRAAGLMLCCPVTSQVKGYPFEVALCPEGTSKVTGVVLCDQIRSLDWQHRKAARLGAVTMQCVLDVAAKVKVLMP